MWCLFYLVHLSFGYTKVCYWDLNDDNLIADQCLDGTLHINYDIWCSSCKKLSEYATPDDDGYDYSAIILSQPHNEVDYDRFVTDSRYSSWPPTVYFVAKSVITGESSKTLAVEQTISVTTAMDELPRSGLAAAKFVGFSSVTIKNTVTTERNTLFAHYLPVTVNDVVQGIFRSSDTRPVEVYIKDNLCAGININDYLGGALNVITFPGRTEISVPELDSTLHEKVVKLPSEVMLMFYNSEFGITLCSNGIKILKNNYWIKMEGSGISLDVDDAVVELTCEDGVTDCTYFRSYMLSHMKSVTLKGDNWPKAFPSDGIYCPYGEKLIIDSNACPFRIDDISEVIVKRENVYINGIYIRGYSGSDMVFKAEGPTTPSIVCGHIECGTTDALQLEGVTMRVEEVEVYAWDTSGIAQYTALTTVEGLTIDSLFLRSGASSSSFDLGSVPTITLPLRSGIMGLTDITLMPSDVFENKDKDSIRNDITTVIDHVHNEASDIAKSLSFTLSDRPLKLSSWGPGKKTIKGRTKNNFIFPLAMMFVDDMVVAESTSSNYEFSKEQWNVDFRIENFVDDVTIPTFTDAYLSGETIWNKNQLIYRHTKVPESAIDIIIYTSDSKWINTFSQFKKYIRILTPNDLNGMEKRVSPNAKNVIVVITESMESDQVIDLSGLRSDANVLVLGCPIQKLVDLAISDEALSIISEVLNDDFDVEKIKDFAKKHIPSITPRVRINFGRVYMAALCWVDYASAGVECTTFAAFMSKLPVTASINCEFAIYDLATYSYAKKHKYQSLMIVPFDMNSANVMFLDKVSFSASEWELQYSCTLLPDSDILCSLNDNYIQKISTSQVGELTVVSFSKNLEYVAKGDAEIPGFRIFTGISSMIAHSISRPVVLEDKPDNYVSKLKHAAKTLDDDFGDVDVNLRFSGSWSSVKKITSPLLILNNGNGITITSPPQVAIDALSFDSFRTITFVGVTGANFAHPHYMRYPLDAPVYQFPESSKVAFSELVLSYSDPWKRRVPVLKIGETESQIVADTVVLDPRCHSEFTGIINKGLSIGYGSSLYISNSVIQNPIDVTIEYNLLYSSDDARFTSPEFTPKSLEIKYAGDNRGIDTNTQVNKAQTLRYFQSDAACKTWKNLAKFSDEEHTGSGEVFNVKLQCVESDTRTALQLTFELTGKTVLVTVPPVIPIGGESDKRNEVSVELRPSETIDNAEFAPGQEVTITTAGGSADAKITFTETVVESNTRVTVEATLVLSKTLVMTGDSAIVAGASGSIEFSATCEVTIIAAGVSLPVIDIGKQKADAAVPKSLTVTLDLAEVNEEEIDEVFGGDGKVLVSGYNLDCDKWISSIKLEVKGDYNFRVKCREVSSGRLLGDVKNEVYVTFGGLSGGAIAGIVIGCVAIVCIAVGCVYFFVFKKSVREDTAEEP